MEEVKEEQAAVLRHLLVNLENKEAEAAESEDGLAEEFSRLKMQSIQYRNDDTFPTKAALIKGNVKKNRYKDIVPFDYTRVKLSLNTSQKDEDYINASFIKGVSGSRAYIATQGPLPHTLLDFLRMIWEYKIQVVVMACREFEMGRKKCERYWPETQEDQFVCEPFTIFCDDDENKGDYRTRKLRITYKNCSRALHQLHYINWPDHGVPDTTPPILDMLQEMRTCQDHDDIPICIHCSAGCGRTGALCVIDYTWNLVKKQTIPPDFSVYNLVQHMRTQRPSLVQTKEQYELIYKTVKFLFEKYLQSLARPNQVQLNASPSPAASADSISALSEESRCDLKSPSQCWPGPESQSPRSTSKEEQVQEHAIAQSNRNDYRWGEGEEEEQPQLQPQQLPQQLPNLHLHHQHHHQHHHPHQPQDLSRRHSDDVTPAQVQDHEDPGLGLISRTGEDQSTEQEDSEPLPKPAIPFLATACLTVEDPYFESPEKTASVETLLHSMTEDPLSFLTPTITLNTACSEHPESSRRLEVTIPPNAAALAVSEMEGTGSTGSPPSPVPPLPERTPESFELAQDEAVVEQCTSSQPVAPDTQRELKPWPKSKSLKVSMTSTAPPTASCPASRSNISSLHLPPPPPPPTAHTRLEDLHPQEGLYPPLPHRTPESFILATEEAADENGSADLQPPRLEPRVGMSSEWAGSPQPKKFLDFVFHNRSKSVRAKSSTQASEPTAVVRQLAPPALVFSGTGSGVEQHIDPVSTESSEDNASHASNGRVMSRTRSLKFFRFRKAKAAAPPAPSQPPPATEAANTGFKFGFGIRFVKPKGPRRYPEPWM